MEIFLTLETPKKKQSDIASWHPFLSQTRSLWSVCKEARVWFLMVEGQVYLQISPPPFTFSSSASNLFLQSPTSDNLWSEGFFNVVWRYLEMLYSLLALLWKLYLSEHHTVVLLDTALSTAQLMVHPSHNYFSFTLQTYIVILFICFLMVIKIFGCHL